MIHSKHSRISVSVVGVLVLLALAGAMSSASYAAGLITGKQIKNNSITSKDIRSTTLTGSDLAQDSLDRDQVNESQLDRVPLANEAETALQLGNLRPDDVMPSDGCVAGKLSGFARIHANAGNIPATYTQAPSYIETAQNCANSAVQVRRQGIGLYFVKFLNNPAPLAFAQVRGDVGSYGTCATTDKVNTAGIDLNAFKVQVVDCGAGTVTEADFALMLP